MKVKRMGMKLILRRIWLISENKIKPSESIFKRLSQTRIQLIKATNNCHKKSSSRDRQHPLRGDECETKNPT